MQQLETSEQIVEAEQQYKRECKGRALALTRMSTDCWILTFFTSSQNVVMILNVRRLS
jgi:hypothetical protein